MATPKYIITDALDFRNRVWELDNVTAVEQACIELLNKLSTQISPRTKKVLEENVKTTYLTAYKSHFKGKAHPVPELNEIVVLPTTGEKVSQHIAYKLLKLSDEEVKKRQEKIDKKQYERDGINSQTGEPRDVELRSIDVEKVIKMSCEFLQSKDCYKIGIGIANLTGLRSNEINMPRNEHPTLGIVEHEMVVLGEFLIAFKGISKKKQEDDCLDYYARPTLAPAKLIVDAWKDLMSKKEVQDISIKRDVYSQTYHQQFGRVYRKFFADIFTSIDGYNDNGEIIKENGSPHKSRAFYVCVLRSILAMRNIRNFTPVVTQYAKNSLAQQSDGEVGKYLGRFDDSLYINVPANIVIPKSVMDIGRMEEPPNIMEIKADEIVETNLNITNFIEFLEPDEQKEIVKLLESGTGELDAVKKMLKIIRNNSKNTVKTVSNVSSQKDSQATVTDGEKTSVTQKVAGIVEIIMHYNRQIQSTDGDFKKIVVPTYNLINKISTIEYNKAVAFKTVKTYLDSRIDLVKELQNMGIVNIANHNNYHRKMDEILAKIMVYRQ